MRKQLVQAVPVKLQRRIPGVRGLSDRRRRRLGAVTACYAPSLQMHLLPDGDVRACCRNPVRLGNIADQRLPEIWAGVRRAEMQRRLAVHDFPPGCENCAAEIDLEGRAGSYPEVFDFWTDRLAGGPVAPEWPIRLEFNLSNSCNLQCIQCSGDLSSSIRIHREHRPPLPKVYDDQFFEDLRLFLPHLEHANFAGGEPFLGSENYRVWELIAGVAPDLDCTVNTNATQWNKRVEAVLEKVRMAFIFSIDGITKDTYESIRIDGDFDLVMRNIDRFCEYAARVGTTVNINHCLMPQNYREFADLLLFAEERGIFANVSVVRVPVECSIAHLPVDELRAVAEHLEAQSEEVLPRLRLNWPTWQKEVRRIRAWADAAIAADAALAPAPAQPLLAFARHGDGPVDADAVMAELAATTDGDVYRFTVDSGERIVEAPAAMGGLLADPAALVGRPLHELTQALAGTLGAPRDQRILSQSADRLIAEAAFANGTVESVLVPLRDAEGTADEVAVFVVPQPG
jgi:MoaA/NifB/PqqE/SkfB family radical SAM enzyme